MRALDLVILGNLVVDDVVLPAWTSAVSELRIGQAGGATLYASLAASLWGARVGMVSRMGNDYPQATLQLLRARGVDTSGVHEMGRPGARTWLLYEAEGRHIVSHEGRPSHEEASPLFADIPQAYLESKAFLIAPMPMKVQASLVKALRMTGASLIALDPFTPLGADTIEAWKTTLRDVDIVFLGPDEMRMGEQALRSELMHVGGHLKQVVMKKGASGGTLYDLETGQQQSWAAGNWPVVDPTGAGDAFAAGYVAEMATGGASIEGLRKAVVSASFAIEEWGPSKLQNATLSEAMERKISLGTLL